MGTCQTPGNFLSSTGIDKQQLSARLQARAKTPAIQDLNNALSPAPSLHIVGGAIREYALQNEKTDLDLATVLPPEIVAERLKATGIRVIETGIAHGTVLALIHDESVEITTFRTPGPRNKAIYSNSIIEDLSGRDFTCNALAYDIVQNQLLDPYNGLEDIKNSLLRCVGDAHERFLEDPLRILRMIRFGPARTVSVTPETIAAAQTLSNNILSVSVERVRSEFEKILITRGVSAAFQMMKDLSFLDMIIPEIVPTYGFDQNEFHIHDVFEHTLWVLDRAEPDLLVRLAALFHDIGKPQSLTVDETGRRHFYKHELIGAEISTTVMERMLFSKKLIRDVALLVRHHMRPLDCGPAAVRRLIRDLGPHFDTWLKLKCADAPPLLSAEYFTELYNNFLALKKIEDTRSFKKLRSGLCLNGSDLQEFGIPPGPVMGTILQTLEEHIIDNPDDNTVEALSDLVKELLKKT